MALVIMFFADMCSENVDIPWWLYLLVFFFDGAFISVRYTR